MKRGVFIFGGLFLLIIMIISYFVVAVNFSPTNIWNVTLNGPQNNGDVGFAITLDNESNIYVTGDFYNERNNTRKTKLPS
ncbi:MAG: hypothetical protein Q7S06_03595 [Nanoarchaeota archaeon]|nr:hypothetical protein [Nanoarchaeota archaeon]